MRIIGAVFGVVVVCAAWVTTASAAAAQDYWRRFDSAQAQLNRVQRANRFSLAAERCQNAVEQRRSEWMIIWCDLAAQAAMRQRNRDDRRDFSDEERALLWDAAWLQALEGLQEGSFFAAPLVERVSIADAESMRRLTTYRLLSNMRSRDYRNVDHYFRQLGELDGVEISPSATLLVGRRQLIEALLEGERTAERFWAIAAAALTYEYEYRAASVSRDDVAADAREIAQRLEGLGAEVEALTGQDAALKPLLLYGRATALMVANEFATAATVADEGHSECVRRLWATASLCLDLGMAAGTAEVMQELYAAHPERMQLPPEQPLSSRRRGEEITEARCRVVMVGDAGDDGDLVNVRVVYTNPRGVCDAMAMRYATARKYRPISEARPDTRRENIVIRFVLTSP